MIYVVTIVITAGITFGLAALLMNIFERKREAREHVFRVVDLDENSVDPARWGENFPRQYRSYLLTVDAERTRHGGSEAFSKLEQAPRLVRLYAGYAFSTDFREERGHAYMLADQDLTERTKKFKQPGACLHCHSSIIPAYREAGNGDVMKGFEAVCKMPLAEARKLVKHPVTCIDCHDPKTTQLRVTRPGFLTGIKALATSPDPLPHMPSIERWRKGSREQDYDPNKLASRQEMRSFVCGQCHVEYYFKGEGKLLTYPWHKGLKVDSIENYYDDTGFSDWTHPETGAGVLKAQHPEFELWNQGIHARSGVSCADCHMPYKREGAVKVSDHHVRSPLLNVERSCMVCHRYGEAEIQARVATIQDRTRKLADRAEDALMQMFDAMKAARNAGVADDQLQPIHGLHRKAQWRLDFVLSENSMGFHAPQESARILGEAIDYARQGQVKALESRKPRKTQ
ncbi:MAG: ammonia-forming cytochrome c nitrite reductase subunit c552 [Planctomycetes bacterium]|nr:ammonia-forming cytochrome c nitrite reductase subunit c552 [Planctomycetota bacterium]